MGLLIKQSLPIVFVGLTHIFAGSAEPLPVFTVNQFSSIHQGNT